MIKKICVLLFLIFILGSFSFAQFKPMLTTNGVLVTSDDASDIFVLSYGDYKIVFWTYNGIDKDVKAKAIDNNGDQVWQEVISDDTDDQSKPFACLTSNNKIVVVWQDKRHDAGESSQEDIYAKQINTLTGSEDWETRVTTSTASQVDPQVCPDSSGGVYIVWGSENAHLYFQHLDSNGNILIGGGAGGEKDLGEINYSFNWKSIEDGSGNLIAVCNYGKSEEVLAFKIDSDGNILASREVAEGNNADIIKSGSAGNYVICYMRELSDRAHEILVEKIDGGLCKIWNVSVAPTIYAGAKLEQRILSDNGSLYICWNFSPKLGEEVIYDEMNVFVQKLNSSGEIEWGEAGKGVATEEGVQVYLINQSGNLVASRSPMAYKDGKIYLAWNDFRREPSFDLALSDYVTSEADIFMQVFDSSTGEEMNRPLPIASAQNAQVLPEITASSPFVFWYDLRDGSTHTIRCQRVDHVPTQITGISSVPAGTIKIIGQGFGCDPADIQDSDFRLGSDYNRVTLDESPVEVTAWSTNEITIVATYDALVPGPHSIEVTAYGDSDRYPFSIIPVSSLFKFENEKFDGFPYSEGGYVTENPSFEVKITSEDQEQNKLEISTVTVEVNGAAGDVTQDFGADRLITDLSLSQDVDTKTYTVKAIARNIFGDEGSKTYTVKVAGAEEGAFIQYLIPSEPVIDSEGSGAAAASRDVILAFNSSKVARVNIIIYTPAGQPIKLVREISAGYNEISVDREIFYSGNGIYIIAVYDKNYKLLGKTWITVRL